jgi:hypothetical protein
VTRPPTCDYCGRSPAWTLLREADQVRAYACNADLAIVVGELMRLWEVTTVRVTPFDPTPAQLAWISRSDTGEVPIIDVRFQ